MSLVSKSVQKYSTFDPRMIGNCLLWLDATDPNGDGTRPADNTSLTRWVNKTRTGVDGVAGPVAPTYSNNSVVFSGAGNVYYTTTSTITFMASPNTFFAVLTVTGTTTRYYPIVGNMSTTSNGYMFTIRRPTAAGNNVGWYSGSSATYSASTGLFASGTQVLVVGQGTGNIGSGTTRTLSTNLNAGTLTEATAPAITNGTSNYIGSRGPVGTVTFQGTINELLVYTSWLSVSNRQAVEGYLLNKWGLTASAPGTHPYATTRPFLRWFAPTDISGCRLWFDAMDSNSFTLSGSNVTVWRDKSGGSRHASNGVSPTITTDGVVFNGSQYLQTPYTAVVTPSNVGEEIYAVITFAETALGAYSILGPSALQGRGIDISLAATRSSIAWTQYGTARTFYNSLSNTVSGRFLVRGSLIYNATSQLNPLVSINGGTLGSGNVSTTYSGAATTQIGASLSNTSFFRGTLHELIVYTGGASNGTNATMSPNVPAQIESYLATKWGLVSSMPSTHITQISAGIVSTQ